MGDGIDIYSGFKDNTADIYNYDPSQDEAFLNAVKISSYGKKVATPKFYYTGETLNSSDGTKILARPSTAVRPVGYSSETFRIFDPLNQAAASKKTMILEMKKEETPEQKYKTLENKINKLLEESVLISTGANSDSLAGLAKAKEASTLDRTLLKLREQNGSYSHNFDLTYSVLFNLANLYSKNDMFIEALNTYTLITKNKMFRNDNRLKINMGNIYFHLGVYPKAIKMYRMALDQVPNNQKELRLKITHNIATLFIKMGQYADAATSFEFIMSEKGDLRSGLHLILCCYALGDIDKMKKAFQLLLDVQIDYNDDERIINANVNTAYDYVFDIIKNDELNHYEQKLKSLAEKNILMAANLISSVIEDNFNDGFTWCVETIKNSNFSALATELDLNKAIMFLKQGDLAQAIESLKYFERKESTIAVNAAINLTFVYLLKKDLPTAEKYAESAKKLDSYNPATYVNSGVCEMLKEDYDASKNMFENALEIDATSFEALYNMGLIYKKTGDYDNALMYFRKIHANLNQELHREVIYQIGNVYEHMGDISAALEWYLQLLGIIQSDAGIFQKIGEMYESDGDRQQAFHYHIEAHRVYPMNFSVINWIGSHFIELQVAEKAISFYEKATLNNPNEPYFFLRIAGCYRRIGNPQKSFQLFQKIHQKFPDNLDCIRALMHLTQTQGLDELYEKYLGEFQRIEKLKELRQRIGSSRPTTTNSRLSGSGRSTGVSSITEMFKNSNSKGNTSSATGGGSNNKSFDIDSPGDNSFSYADPLGPPTERPRTGARKVVEEDSEDDMNPEELLPI